MKRHLSEEQHDTLQRQLRAVNDLAEDGREETREGASNRLGEGAKEADKLRQVFEDLKERVLKS